MATTTGNRTAQRRDQLYRYLRRCPNRRASIRQIGDALGWPYARVRSVLRNGNGAFKPTNDLDGNWRKWTVLDAYRPDQPVADPDRARPAYNGPVRGVQSDMEINTWLASMHRFPDVETGTFYAAYTNVHGFTVSERCYTKTYYEFVMRRFDQ